MHHQFNIQQLYALPTLYLCVLYLSENKQRLVPLTANLFGFYNRDEKCLQRGTDWVFKWSSLRFVFKSLIIQLVFLRSQFLVTIRISPSVSGCREPFWQFLWP